MNIINHGNYSRAALIFGAHATCGYYLRATTICCAATIYCISCCYVTWGGEDFWNSFLLLFAHPLIHPETLEWSVTSSFLNFFLSHLHFIEFSCTYGSEALICLGCFPVCILFSEPFVVISNWYAAVPDLDRTFIGWCFVQFLHGTHINMSFSLASAGTLLI